MKMKARLLLLLLGWPFIAAVAVRRRHVPILFYFFGWLGSGPKKGILMRGRNRRFELSMSCKPSGFSSFFRLFRPHLGPSSASSSAGPYRKFLERADAHSADCEAHGQQEEMNKNEGPPL